MKIAIIVEGETEKAFLPHLRALLKTQLAGQMPKLDLVSFNGRIPKGEKLKRIVERLLALGKEPAEAVIALTDVYTGTSPPDFVDAADAKAKMRSWVGPNPAFHPHAAQYDFEAWLLPYWSEIQRLARSNRTAPGASPEGINHNDPPSHRIQEVFRTGGSRRAYVKPRDAHRILLGKDLLVAARACPELKGFLNTILTLCQATPIP
jgi:hypothetical protein